MDRKPVSRYLLLPVIALVLPLMGVEGSAQMTQLSGASAGPSFGSGASVAGSDLEKLRGSSQSMAPTVLPADFAKLLIEPGDQLNVKVYDTPELSDSYRVDSEGYLTLPLCGKVKVEGLKLEEAASRVETLLKQSEMLVQPQVSLNIDQYAGNYVAVFGEVANPGRVQVIAPTKLSDILAQVGGETAMAAGHVTIRHGNSGGAAEEQVLLYSRNQSNAPTADALLLPGDLVVIPRAGIVYVLGAVYKPGGYIMQEDGKLNVAQALALSGGTLLQAKTNGLRVIRRDPDGKVMDFELSYNGIVNGTQSPLILQPQDIVYVPMSKIKAILSDATSIISSATSAAIYSVAVH